MLLKIYIPLFPKVEQNLLYYKGDTDYQSGLKPTNRSVPLEATV